MNEQSDDETYLNVDADGSDGSPLAVSTFLRSVAETLEHSPPEQRYDFALRIDERSEDTGSNADDQADEPEPDPFAEWLNSEINRRSREIEDLAPRGSKGEDHKRKSDQMVGINRGLRIARDEYAEQQKKASESDPSEDIDSEPDPDPVPDPGPDDSGMYSDRRRKVVCDCGESENLAVAVHTQENEVIIGCPECRMDIIKAPIQWRYSQIPYEPKDEPEAEDDPEDES